MPIGTDGDGTDDNEGPHCRNCHVGANDCFTCHSNDDKYAVYTAGGTQRIDVSSAYDSTTTAGSFNRSNYSPPTTYRQSAVVGAVGDPCLDGGFSFPHRTLGSNMLKDELWGVDFDGTPISAGTTRTANAVTPSAMLAAYAGTAPQAAIAAGANNRATDADAEQINVTDDWYYYLETKNASSIIPAVQTDNVALVGQRAENLDSVCIDCHGDATYWQGDNPALYVFKAGTGAQYGDYGYGDTFGWELLLKGLP